MNLQQRRQYEVVADEEGQNQQTCTPPQVKVKDKLLLVKIIFSIILVISIFSFVANSFYTVNPSDVKFSSNNDKQREFEIPQQPTQNDSKQDDDTGNKKLPFVEIETIKQGKEKYSSISQQVIDSPKDNSRQQDQLKDNQNTGTKHNVQQTEKQSSKQLNQNEVKESDKVNVKSNQAFICKKNLVYSSNSCTLNCQDGFLVDQDDRLCKPKNQVRNQIKLHQFTYTNFNGQLYIIYFQSLRGKGSVENGFILFNEDIGDRFNYLNSMFGQSSLSDILDNIDGVIFSISLDSIKQNGTDQTLTYAQFNVRTEEIGSQLIKFIQNSNQKITNWFSIGASGNSGFLALHYFGIMAKYFSGVFVMDPYYESFDSYYQGEAQSFSIQQTFQRFRSDIGNKSIIISELESSILKSQSQNLIINSSSFNYRYKLIKNREDNYLENFLKIIEEIVNMQKKLIFFNQGL